MTGWDNKLRSQDSESRAIETYILYLLVCLEGVTRVFGSTDLGLKAHGLWIFAVNGADSRILKKQWIVDQLWILARILDFVCLDVVRILGPERNFDDRSFFSLGQ